MYTFIFTKKAEKKFQKADKIFQRRLLDKLRFLKDSENLSHFISKLENMPPYTHRIRIWDIRVLLAQDSDNGNIFLILNFWKRGDIYK